MIDGLIVNLRGAAVRVSVVVLGTNAVPNIPPAIISWTEDGDGDDGDLKQAKPPTSQLARLMLLRLMVAELIHPSLPDVGDEC